MNYYPDGAFLCMAFLFGMLVGILLVVIL